MKKNFISSSLNDMHQLFCSKENKCMTDHFCHLEQIKVNQSSVDDEWPPPSSTNFFFSFISFLLMTFVRWSFSLFRSLSFLVWIMWASAVFSCTYRIQQAPDCRLQKKKLISFFYWFATYMCLAIFLFSSLSLSYSPMNGNRSIVIVSPPTNPSIHDHSKCASE